MEQQFQDCIKVARAELAQARQLLNSEITNYPVPIAGCDVQFNHLLAERQKVLSALDVLEDAVFIPTPRMPAPAVRIESR